MTGELDLAVVSAFIFQEARYADEHDYDAWEALWTDDAVYWVPIAASYQDPASKMSIVYDNRRRLHTRMDQLRTGFRHAQTPQSRLRRLVTNIEVLGTEANDDGGTDTVVGANFMIHERRERYAETWVGRVTYKLRQVAGGVRMAAKTVELVNQDEPLSTIGFIL